MEFLNSKFIEKINCLTYLQTDIEIVTSILNNYKPSEDFDIDEFVKLDAVPLKYRWGYWSLYGNSDVMPDKPIQHSPFFIPVNVQMDSYLDYTIIKFAQYPYETITSIFDNVKLDIHMTRLGYDDEEVGLWITFYPNEDDDCTHYFELKLVRLHSSRYPEVECQDKNFLVRKKSIKSEKSSIRNKSLRFGQIIYYDEFVDECKFLFLIKKTDHPKEQQQQQEQIENS